MMFICEISKDKCAITLEKYAKPSEIEKIHKVMMESDGSLISEVKTGGQKLLFCSAPVISLALALEIRSQLGDD